MLRSAAALSVVTVFAVTPLRAQQVQDSLPAQDSAQVTQQVPAAVSGQPTRSSTGLMGPRLSPGFQGVQPRLAPASGTEGSSLMAARNHTITISTLSLVLIVIIVVLLVT